MNLLFDTNLLYKNLRPYKDKGFNLGCTFLNIFDFLSSSRIVINGPINKVKLERWRNAIKNSIINCDLIQYSHWHMVATYQFGAIKTSFSTLNLANTALTLTEKIVNNKFDQSDEQSFIDMVTKFKNAKVEFSKKQEEVIRNGYNLLANNNCLIINKDKELVINDAGLEMIRNQTKSILIENLNAFSKKDCNGNYQFDVSSFKWDNVIIWHQVYSNYLKNKIIKRKFSVAPNDYVDYFNLLYLGDDKQYATDEKSIIENFKESACFNRLITLK